MELGSRYWRRKCMIVKFFSLTKIVTVPKTLIKISADWMNIQKVYSLFTESKNTWNLLSCQGGVRISVLKTPTPRLFFGAFQQKEFFLKPMFYESRVQFGKIVFLLFIVWARIPQTFCYYVRCWKIILKKGQLCKFLIITNGKSQIH